MIIGSEYHSNTTDRYQEMLMSLSSHEGKMQLREIPFHINIGSLLNTVTKKLDTREF